MYQHELFSSQTSRNAKYLDKGAFASVFAVDDEWVIKQAKERDGTLNYLEWCHAMQKAGKGMKGMPLIDFITHTDEGYVAGMRRYIPWDYQYGSLYSEKGPLEKPYVVKLREAWKAHAEYVLCAGRLDWDDIHGGNVMWDKEAGHAVITDPLCCEYVVAPASWGALEQ